MAKNLYKMANVYVKNLTKSARHEEDEERLFREEDPEDIYVPEEERDIEEELNEKAWENIDEENELEEPPFEIGEGNFEDFAPETKYEDVPLTEDDFFKKPEEEEFVDVETLPGDYKKDTDYKFEDEDLYNEAVMDISMLKEGKKKHSPPTEYKPRHSFEDEDPELRAIKKKFEDVYDTKTYRQEKAKEKEFYEGRGERQPKKMPNLLDEKILNKWEEKQKKSSLFISPVIKMAALYAKAEKGTEGAFFEGLEDLPEEEEAISLKETLHDPGFETPVEETTRGVDVKDEEQLSENEPGDPGEYMPLTDEQIEAEKEMRKNRLDLIKERHKAYLEGKVPPKEEDEEELESFELGPEGDEEFESELEENDDEEGEETDLDFEEDEI